MTLEKEMKPGITRDKVSSKGHEHVEGFCPFCDGLEQGSRFYEKYPELEGIPQVLYQTDNVMVLPDFAPVKSGHVLIVPKEHVTSYAFLSEQVRVEFGDVYQHVREVLGKPDNLEFEHGSGFIDRAKVACGNSVFHAHWHVVPISGQVEGIKILDRMLDEVPNGMKPIGMRADVDPKILLEQLAQASNGNPYLVFRNSSWAAVFREETNLGVPSQILRKLSAAVLHGDNGRWNWKEASENDRQIWLENLKQTYRRFGFEV